MLVVSSQEMRALDRQTIDEVGVPGAVLMESAGRGVVEIIEGLGGLGEVVVYAGAGNNGGDGFVVARHLANRGARVRVIVCAAVAKIGGDARTHFYACKRTSQGVEILDGSSEEALRDASTRTAGASVVVDALFGTGLERPVTGLYASVVDRINAHAGIKVAVDVPSGLDSDRGVALGACVRADHTVTFAFPKRGLVG